MAGNVDILRPVYEQWQRGELRAGVELLDPRVESVWPEEFPSGGTYHGREGHARAMREWLDPWEDFRLFVEALDEQDDCVTVTFRVTARGRGSDVRVERRWQHVWTMRDGRAIRFEVRLPPQ
jgi:ketosteroid isomerase-like protein